MLIRPIFESFRSEFLDYFNHDVICAEFDHNQNLIVFANPFHDFEALIFNICDNILETVYFRQHLELHIYPFGSNEPVYISIN